MSGSVDGYVYEVMRETEPDLIVPTKVIRQSEPMGFPPIACAAGIMDASKTEALRAALVRMAEHPDGQAVLRLLRLDGFSVEGPDLYDTIATEVAVVRGGAG